MSTSPPESPVPAEETTPVSPAEPPAAPVPAMLPASPASAVSPAPADPSAPTGRIPGTPGPDEAAVLAYAEEQLAWYARIRDRSRRFHWTVELTALLTGAATVVAAGIQAPAAITASVAGAAVFIGGFRQVFHHNERYVLAAEAWMRLHLAVRRYATVPEASRDDETRHRLLAEIEATATTELQNWAAVGRGAGGALPAGPGAPTP
ncbi:DUF4231 domain-containing protein [Streptomyces sp. NPDC020875]|uniref:DUF4231 domain-containing protein n=1 Tax=Streptomyces sp. NPDC020875 TaxID=3154898 RepID=UPI0033D02A63